MGLDMYLNKKHYVKNWKHNDEKFNVSTKLNGKKHPAVNPRKVKYVEEEVMCWRKANAIHQWFVKHVQDGKDECQESYVDPTKLEELLKTCKDVIENLDKDDHAENNLPTQGGFFFGDTEYDEYYVQDIKDTIKILEKEIPTINELGALAPEYYYRASW